MSETFTCPTTKIMQVLYDLEENCAQIHLSDSEFY